MQKHSPGSQESTNKASTSAWHNRENLGNGWSHNDAETILPSLSLTHQTGNWPTFMKTAAVRTAHHITSHLTLLTAYLTNHTPHALQSFTSDTQYTQHTQRYTTHHTVRTLLHTSVSRLSIYFVCDGRAVAKPNQATAPYPSPPMAGTAHGDRPTD